MTATVWVRNSHPSNAHPLSQNLWPLANPSGQDRRGACCVCACFQHRARTCTGGDAANDGAAWIIGRISTCVCINRQKFRDQGEVWGTCIGVRPMGNVSRVQFRDNVLLARAVLKKPDFFFLRTALKDSPQGPPTANRHQPPTAANHHQPPTTNPFFPFRTALCSPGLFQISPNAPAFTGLATEMLATQNPVYVWGRVLPHLPPACPNHCVCVCVCMCLCLFTSCVCVCI